MDDPRIETTRSEGLTFEDVVLPADEVRDEPALSLITI